MTRKKKHKKADKQRIEAFEMKGLRRRILRVSWTAKKTNDWVLEKAGVTATSKMIHMC